MGTKKGRSKQGCLEGGRTVKKPRGPAVGGSIGRYFGYVKILRRRRDIALVDRKLLRRERKIKV